MDFHNIMNNSEAAGTPENDSELRSTGDSLFLATPEMPKSDRHVLSDIDPHFLNKSTPKNAFAHKFAQQQGAADDPNTSLDHGAVTNSYYENLLRKSNEMYTQEHNDYPEVGGDSGATESEVEAEAAQPGYARQNGYDHVSGYEPSGYDHNQQRYNHTDGHGANGHAEPQMGTFHAQNFDMPPSSPPSHCFEGSDSLEQVDLNSPTMNIDNSRIDSSRMEHLKELQQEKEREQEKETRKRFEMPKFGSEKLGSFGMKKFPDMRRSVMNNSFNRNVSRTAAAPQRSENVASTQNMDNNMAMVPSPKKERAGTGFYVNPLVGDVYGGAGADFFNSRRSRNARPASKVQFSPVRQYKSVPGRNQASFGRSGRPEGPSGRNFNPRGSYYSPTYDASYDETFEERYAPFERNHSDEWEEYDHINSNNHNVNTPMRTPRRRDGDNGDHSDSSDKGDFDKSKKSFSSNSSKFSKFPNSQNSQNQTTPTSLNLPILLSIWLQLAYNAIMMAVLSYFVWTFYSTIKRDVDMKVEEYSADILQEMAMCSKDYLANNCMPGKRVPALEAMCNAWERCMNRDPKVVGRARVSAETFAEIINGFLRPISFKSIIFMTVLIGGSMFACNYAFGTYRGPLYGVSGGSGGGEESDEAKSGVKKEKKRGKSDSRESRESRESRYDSPGYYPVSPRYHRSRYRRRY